MPKQSPEDIQGQKESPPEIDQRLRDLEKASQKSEKAAEKAANDLIQSAYWLALSIIRGSGDQRIEDVSGKYEMHFDDQSFLHLVYTDQNPERNREFKMIDTGSQQVIQQLDTRDKKWETIPNFQSTVKGEQITWVEIIDKIIEARKKSK